MTYGWSFVAEGRGVGSVCENITAQRDDLQQQFWSESNICVSCLCNLSQTFVCPVSVTVLTLLSLSDLQTSHQTVSEQRDELEQQLHGVSESKSLSTQNWNFVNGSFYLSDASMLSWKNSRQYCLDRGADLIIINSPEEQEFAMTFGERSWIGLTDAQQEGCGDGFWFPDEPNNDKGNEDCVEVLSSKPKHANWNDLPCDDLRKVICEKTL
uniref:C-type lectin domain-containing protein n=1 Tax=Neogobius melanostomus TaxID=47308 RepID=A0A8C6U531_9GOBI